MAVNKILPIKEKLEGASNFNLWHALTVSYLQTVDLYEVAIGAEKKPGHRPVEERAAWTRKDCQVQKIISSSVDQKLLIHLISCTSGKEMFEKMKLLFGRSEKETNDLLDKFFKVSYNTRSGMVEFFRKIDRTVSRLRYKNVNITDTMIVNRVISALPPCYEDFVNEWEATKEKEKTVDNLRGRLIGNDVWKKYAAMEPEVVKPPRPDGTAHFECWICKSPYHNCGYCLKNYVNRKSKAHFVNGIISYGRFDYFDSTDAKKKGCKPSISHPRCLHCKKDNHGTRNCFFRPKKTDSRHFDDESDYENGIFSLFPYAYVDSMVMS